MLRGMNGGGRIGGCMPINRCGGGTGGLSIECGGFLNWSFIGLGGIILNGARGGNTGGGGGLVVG